MIRTLLVSSTSALGVLGLLDADPIETGQTLSRLGVSAILGVVAVCCVMAVIYVYRDKQKQDADDRQILYKLIQDSTAAQVAASAALTANTAIQIEVKDAIKGCMKNQG